MNNDFKRTNLSSKILMYHGALKKLLEQIKNIEFDNNLSSNDKLNKIKKIQEELNKIGAEIDIIKKEINLLSNYNIN